MPADPAEEARCIATMCWFSIDDVYELLGRNLSGGYLHIVYRVLPDNRLRIFHMNGMTEAQKKRYRRVSEMKKTKRKVPRLSRNATDEEIVRWTKSHDVFDRLEAGVSEIIEDHSDLDQVLRDAIFQDNTAQLNMRLPPAMKAVLSKLARQRTTDATTLARIWLAERLERELKAS